MSRLVMQKGILEQNESSTGKTLDIRNPKYEM